MSKHTRPSPEQPAEYPPLPAISLEAPCGASLEYDPEYAVLQARLQPKAEVQYGQFATKPEGPDWTDIERDCRRLLLKSTDISLLIWLTRARTRVAGASGLAYGLGTLLATLQAWPEHIHPQLSIDGYFDPAVRANALAALCDPEGLLGDIRETVVSSSTAFRLTMRDIERAHAIPRPPYSPEPEAVNRQLQALHAKGDSTVHSMLQAAHSAKALAHWVVHGSPNQSSQSHQWGDDAPNLQPLLKLFAALSALDVASNTHNSNPHTAHPDQQEFDQAPIPTEKLIALAGPDATPHATFSSSSSASNAPLGQHYSASQATQLPVLSTADQREQIRAMLIQVRQWIEHNEPSSPVAVLLKQAQRMWGKRFSEVATLIPPELLQAWDQDDLN
ncbi:type VI secretion system ImpA family N-terminal domain-containing protein [Curvibacter sp. CHRR-16]|uniref:type VI secretion system protein TssA n=1 Tax=Curvibacter sp. CHRR-16 TaxID=2835872 RepID=UPI001BD947D3|nr:type VI secretion system ImpA family N-terminal domain-containing protein [Curvibacter sp. CHRR-16]MBT0571859.1 type VI secretion system ImpA family N-terminal domain-containing protein [Curvibacter sp. CHRR-16]